MKLNEGNGFRSETWTSPALWGSSGYNWITDVDGDGILEIASVKGGSIYIKKQNKTKKNQIISFNTSGNSFDVGYMPLTAPSIYQKNTLNVSRNNLVNYPASYDSINQLTPPSYVVSAVTQPDGAGGSTSTNYKYEGFRYDAYAKRALGFSKTIIENPKTDIRSTTTYSQAYPYIGMATSTLTELMSNEQPLSKSTQSGFAYRDTSGKKTYFPYATEQSDITYLLDDNLIEVGTKTVTTNSTYNTSGQVTNSVITTSGSDGLGSFSVTTTNQYQNGYTARRQGEITRATVSSSAPGEITLTRTSSFEYDWSKGHLIKEVIQPGHADPSIRRVSVYGYDGFGNRTSTVTCDGRFEFSCTTSASGARYSSVQFSSDGLFATSATNALGYTSYSVYDARFGVVTSTTDINGLTSTFTYDSLGRQRTTKNPFNQTTTITRAWCDYTCPTIGDHQTYYKITTQAPSTPTTVVYFDQLNREVRKQTEGFNAEKIFVDTEYDDFGRVKRTSEPYFQGDTPYWNTPVYDALGRKIHMITPNQDGSYDTTSTISYQGFTTEVTDALGRTVTEVKNVLGQVVKMTDKAQNDTLYEYDALGNLTKTTDVAGNEVILSYDIRGRKTQMNDPGMGTWKYKYNTFDQLVEQTDAKNQKTVMVYDAMGRMTSRTDAYGTANAQTASWSYYTTPVKSRGKLYQKTAANGDYTRYTYNTTYGQLIQTDQKIGTKTFSVKHAYDALGRVSSITYPATTAYSTGFKVVQQYNAKGYLSLVRKDDNTKTYWRADAISPRGQLEAATYGNGTQELSAHSDANGWLIASVVAKGSSDLMDMTYEFDAVGNIKKRIDGRQQDMTEAFDYDELDRLTHSTIYGGPTGVNHIDKFYSYDDMGNITSKSDVGSYSYAGCGNRPHAVCSAGGKTYVYDANGSMTQVKIGTTVNTTVNYTAFNKANYMQKGNYAVTFNYDADRQRNYKSRVQNGSLNLQTYYVGSTVTGSKIFEQEVSSATGTKDIHYIFGAGGQAVATHITEGGSRRTEYFHRDHLGSVALVTNDAG
jgi:YD repeat-containing protein